MSAAAAHPERLLLAAEFMIRHDRVTEPQLLEAFSQMKPIELVELREAFERAKPVVIKLTREGSKKYPFK